MSYYNDILLQINSLIQAKAYKEAELLVNEEMNMPYIPPDILIKLIELQSQITIHTKSDRPKALDEETIRKLLDSDISHQESAVYALNELNLRSHFDLVQTALNQVRDPFLLKILIHICIKQALTETFSTVIDEVQYTFIPASLTLFTDSEGYLRAKDLLKQYLQDDNPSMLELCFQQLEVQSILHYPLSYDDEEGEELAYYCLKSVYLSISNEIEFNEFIKKKNIRESIKLSTL